MKYIARIFLAAACVLAVLQHGVQAEDLKVEAADLVKVLLAGGPLDRAEEDANYRRLKEIGPEAANSPLPPSHKDWWWTTAALRGEAVRHLRPLLKSEDKKIREKALEIIRLNLRHDARALLPDIMRLVEQDPSNEVRIAAVRTIAAIGVSGPKTETTLVETYRRTEDDWLAMALLDTIGAVGSDNEQLRKMLAEVAEGKRHGDVRYRAMHALARIDRSGTTSAPLLARLLKDKLVFGSGGLGTREIYQVAGWELRDLGARSALGAPEVVPMFQRGEFDNADWFALTAAMDVLRLAPAEAKKVEPLLGQYLLGKFPPKTDAPKDHLVVEVQIAAALALRSAHSGKDAACEELLLSILRNDKWMREGESISKLGTYYADPRPEAAEGAGKLGPGFTAALPHLRKLMEEGTKREYYELENEAAWAIAQIDLADTECLDHFPSYKLRSLFRANEPSRVAKILGKRSVRLVPKILPLVFGSEDNHDKVTPSVRDFVLAIDPDMMPQVIDEGIRRLKSKENEDNPELAAINLGAFGNRARATIPRLLELLHDSDVQVRARAAVCLGLLQQEPAQTVPALVAALDDSRILVRARAAESLARFGKDAAPALEALNNRAKDESEWVRTVVAEALQSINGR